MPKVSIVVPCYNHEKFITTLVESIYGQSYKDFELIILDDGSKDSSPQILKALAEKYKFQLVLKENEGICKTLNKGISLSQGEYFIAIASDDYMPSNRLQEQVDFFDSHPDVDVVSGTEIVVDNDGNERGLKTPSIKGHVTFEDMVKINRVLTATVMMRMSVFTRFGTYDESHLFEDYHMWLKLLKNGGKIFNTSNMWAYYRISNPDLEKKFNWYFAGAVQALGEYAGDEIVQKSIARLRFIYAIKTALLIGNTFFSKYSGVAKLLTWNHKFVVSVAGALPVFLRHWILTVLKVKA